MSGYLAYKNLAKGASVALSYVGTTVNNLKNAAIKAAHDIATPGTGVNASEDQVNGQPTSSQKKSEADNSQQKGKELDTGLKAQKPNVKQDHNVINRRATMLDDEDEEEWDDMYVPPCVVNRDIVNEEYATGVTVEQGQWVLIPR